MTKPNQLPIDPDVFQPGQSNWPPHFLPGLQLAVFIGGCLGTLVRYGVSILLPTQVGMLAAGTLLVNLLGAFLLGFLLETLANKGRDEGRRRFVRLGVGTGIIGGFTTYSTFAVESVLLLKDGYEVMGLVYLLVTIIGGLLCTALGIYLASHKAKAVRS